MLETATEAAKKAREQFDAQDRELIGLRTKLNLVGDKGLAEALAEAERVTFEAEDAMARLQRRAEAAKLLYETLSTERQAMRRAYVAPLRDGIERLGRHVFGPAFRVDVDERLQVVSRTVDGVTVSVKQLSTGAQEQLGLLVRLAAASMVSKDGGIPPLDVGGCLREMVVVHLDLGTGVAQGLCDHAPAEAAVDEKDD